MGFFGGLITLISVIGVVIAAFVIGAIVGIVAFYLAMKKFYPEVWLALDLKVSADNQASVKKEMEENESEEIAKEECA